MVSSEGNVVRFSPQSHGSKTPKTLLLLARNESCFVDRVCGLALLSPPEDIATELINLKPHKHLNFIKGMQALSLMQSTL